MADSSIAALLDLLDARLGEMLFPESAMPTYRFRIVDAAQTPLVEACWDPRGGLQSTGGPAPTCLVEIRRDVVDQLLAGVDSSELLERGQVRIGGLGHDFFVLTLLFEPPETRKRWNLGMLAATLSTRRRVASAERARALLTEQLGAVPESIEGLLEQWVQHRISTCTSGNIVASYLPDLPMEAWVQPEAPIVELCREAHDGLLAEAQELLSGRLKVPHYGRTQERADQPVGANPRGWRHWNLVQNFEALPRNQQPFPVASRLVNRIAEQYDVMVGGFLLLEPDVHIPSHSDGACWALSQQFGLIVPEGCHLTVAWEQRAHLEGGSLSFNDSFFHRAGNPSSRHRVLFNVTFSNPRLSAAERQALRLLWREMPAGTLALYNT